MSALSDAVASLMADDAALEAEVDAAITTIEGIPGVVAKAVSDALAAAGTDATTSAAALATVDAAVKAETAKLTNALKPPPPPGPVALSVSPASISSPVGAAVSATLSVSGGTSPYHFASSLADIAVDASGVVSGTPTAAETGAITVTDSAMPAQTATVSVTIA